MPGAKTDLTLLLRLEPRNADAQALFAEVQKAVKEEKDIARSRYAGFFQKEPEEGAATEGAPSEPAAELAGQSVSQPA